MTYKKYNPFWEGYMADFLRGYVGINQIKIPLMLLVSKSS
ncbi:hypothetical protein MEG1DRAFT_03348 [Photorhabdus temperata subsp. temperata Meg1]|uniref:Uncharacterized protein n=2 Tax=Photorhabdus temperata TaxID=574560 RepID=A0A081RTM7_PHOTE|nr:putative membrane protein precursor [Photorhabdus temperata subsp. temperata M1021]ERT10717.1 hypothetical protein O185_23225 [Photorhabdus temperata J3]KER02030.1 hypothetical protein MEG1DRAFT_03348 [Photorhabdus temperata subsp. temperata Meg1]